MAEAALLTKGLKSASHKGVISLFGGSFVKTGIFDKELGRALNDVYDRRLIGDYGVGLSLSKAEAEADLAMAKKFVEVVKGFLEQPAPGKSQS